MSSLLKKYLSVTFVKSVSGSVNTEWNGQSTLLQKTQHIDE